MLTTSDAYQQYELEKRRLRDLDLSPAAYEAAILELAERLGI